MRERSKQKRKEKEKKGTLPLPAGGGSLLVHYVRSPFGRGRAINPKKKRTHNLKLNAGDALMGQLTMSTYGEASSSHLTTSSHPVPSHLRPAGLRRTHAERQTTFLYSAHIPALGI